MEGMEEEAALAKQRAAEVTAAAAEAAAGTAVEPAADPHVLTQEQFPSGTPDGSPKTSGPYVAPENFAQTTGGTKSSDSRIAIDGKVPTSSNRQPRPDDAMIREYMAALEKTVVRGGATLGLVIGLLVLGDAGVI